MRLGKITRQKPFFRMDTNKLRVLILLLLPFRWVSAQPGPCGGAQSGTIACLLPNVAASLFAQSGSQASPNIPTGDAILVTPLVATQPIPSPASGFVYTYDASAGVYVRSSQSLGPILSERAETIGRKKLFIGYTFQRIVFDKVDGTGIHVLYAGVPLPVSNGVITEKVNVSLQLNQSTFFATYGVSNRIDLSLAVPYATVYMADVINAVFTPNQSTGPGMPEFAEGSHTARGLGDINIQGKGTVLHSDTAALAVGSTLRLPTGNDYEALGTGTIGFKPFIAGSISYKKIHPHLDLGYLLNGKSVLSGNILTGDKRQLPDQFLYSLGVDASATKRLTLAVDLLGAEVIHGDRVGDQGFYRKSYNMTNASTGFKVNIAGHLLLVANLLFRLNDSGARANIVPLVGVSYAF
ncbi:MAG TPA: hypothetical protein VHW09_18395 [Bryobacteraceae bacterium]|jgi:hypothetical protein|nr:hypothetical protein [Bryobacteraceae bacterium]